MACGNRSVQKDLDKGVRLGNTSYPDKLEKSTRLILQYGKEKERELLCRKNITTTNTIITIMIIITMIITTNMMVKTMIKQKLLVAL